HDVVRSPPDIVRMAILAVRVDVSYHELRIDLPYRGVVQAPFRIGPGLRTFHPDVRALEQAHEQLASARPGEVERNAKNVAPLLYPVGRGLALAVARFEPDADRAPSGIADAGAFDLDDLGAHVGGECRAERLGNQGAARDDFDSLERSECLGYKGFLRHHDLLPNYRGRQNRIMHRLRLRGQPARSGCRRTSPDICRIREPGYYTE